MSNSEITKLKKNLDSSAQVTRDNVMGEEITKGNEMLREIGTLINPIPKGIKYVGSMATHIYQSEMLGQIFFMGQVSTLGECPEETASAALSNLRGDAQGYYGRSRQKKRSGF